MIYGIVLFTLALVFYSLSVWAGWFSKRLKKWHVYVFFIGLTLDLIATYLTYLSIGSIVLTPHATIGFISLFLMALHVLWATIILLRGQEKQITTFHRISLIVWSIWMFSYLSGFVLGMAKII